VTERNPTIAAISLPHATVSQSASSPVAGVYPPVVTAAPWDEFVLAHPQGHLLQTSAWGTLKSQFGWRDGGVVLLDPAAEIRAGALLLFRRAAGLTIAYAPKGPLTNWRDHTQTAELFLQLQIACQREGAALLKIEPDMPDTADNRALLRGYGLRPSTQTVQPRSTILLDITGDDDTIMQRMKSKWRYNVRLAKRKGVTVREAAVGDLAAINELMQVTGERDGFAVHSAAYYRKAYELFVPKHGVYLLAEYEGQPLAAIVVCTVGQTAYYLWGASSDRQRNRMPNHALQWAGIQWAKAQGATRYDFWGIPDEIGLLAQGLHSGDDTDVPNDIPSGIPSEKLPINLEALPRGELWGVYRFKQGFGGDVVRTVGAWDLPIHPIGYQLYTGGLATMRKARTFGTALQAYREQFLPAQPASSSQSVPDNQSARGSLSLAQIPDATQWRTTLAAFSSPHVLQSWEWGQIKAQTGWHAERYALRQQNEPIAAFQFLWRQPLSQLPLRIGYITKGPTLEWADVALVDQTLAQIEHLARQRNCILVKIDPDVRVDTPAGRMVLHALQRRGWRYSNEQIQFKNTGLSDLAIGEPALLAQMKSKWRYNIRLAGKRNVSVRIGTTADLATFYRLYAETGARDGFLVRPFAYYRHTWETFLQAEADRENPTGGTLLLAEHSDETEPLAGLFLFRYGERSWYFYGASSDRRRRDMPNYLLQWEALRWSLEHGCSSYDWWGAPADPDNPDDDMAGVWQFKQGFGAELQPHIGAWDFPVMPLAYRIYQEALPKTLQLMRHLRG